MTNLEWLGKIRKQDIVNNYEDLDNRTIIEARKMKALEIIAEEMCLLNVTTDSIDQVLQLVK